MGRHTRRIAQFDPIGSPQLATIDGVAGLTENEHREAEELAPFEAVPLLWVTLGVGAGLGLVVGVVVVLGLDRGGIPDTWTEAVESVPGLVAALAAIVAIDQLLMRASKVVDTPGGKDEAAVYEQLRGTAPVLTSAATFTYLLVALVGKGGWQTGLAVGILAYVAVLASTLVAGKRSLARKRGQRRGAGLSSHTPPTQVDASSGG